jgi:hypothetical protein
MMASLGAWSELRHDTILYVKQFAAEAGGHPRGTTSRIEIAPQAHPVHRAQHSVFLRPTGFSDYPPHYPGTIQSDGTGLQGKASQL